MAQNTFRGQTVTDQEIQQAMSDFDSRYPDSNSYELWLDKKTYKYAIWQNEKLYPPKYILSLATGLDTTDFFTGEAKRVLRQLGFEIIKKP